MSNDITNDNVISRADIDRDDRLDEIREAARDKRRERRLDELREVENKSDSTLIGDGDLCNMRML
jgi:hypothetical protein